MIIIGDENKFAVQIQITEDGYYLMGKACFWIDGKCIGYFDDEIMLKVFLTLFKDILLYNKIPLYTKVLSSMEESNVLPFILNSKDDTFDSSIVYLCENFDDFIIRSFFDLDSIVFIWKISDTPNFEYPNSIKNKVFRKSIKISDLQDVYNRTEEIILNGKFSENYINKKRMNGDDEE